MSRANGQGDGPETRSALVIIDMTVEQVETLCFRKAETIDAIRTLLERNRGFRLVVDSRLWIDDQKGSSLWSVFPGVGRADAPGSALIPELSSAWTNLTPAADAEKSFEPKFNYSAFYESNLDARLRACEIRRVYLVGINTDYCVFATALDAFYRGYEVKIVSDAVSSFNGEQAHEHGLALAVGHFGKSAIVSTEDMLASQGMRH
jgi:nicotinamidase-related amidase